MRGHIRISVLHGLPQAIQKQVMGTRMTDDEYVYDEDSGEWIPASELERKRQQPDHIEVRDAVGNLHADGDQVTLIKDMTAKGAGQTLKHGTLIRTTQQPDDPQATDSPREDNKGPGQAPEKRP